MAWYHSLSLNVNWVEPPKHLSILRQNFCCSSEPVAAAAAAAAKSLQSCRTLCDPIDGNPPGSPIPGILQARTGVGCHFLLQCMKVKKWKWSCSVMSDSSWSHGLQPTRLLCPWDFAGKSTGVGCHKHYLVNWLNCMRRKLFLLKSKLGKAILTFWPQCKTSPFQSCMQQPGRSRCIFHHQLPIPTPELWVSLICRIKHLSIPRILIPSPTLQALTYTCIFVY